MFLWINILKKRVTKKWNRQCWNCTHKVLKLQLTNNTIIWIVKMTGRWCSWKPSKQNIILLKIKKATVNILYFAPLQFSKKHEWSVCSSLNIKYQSTGVSSLPLLVKIEPRQSIQDVSSCNRQFLMDVLVKNIFWKYRYKYVYRCLYEQNNHVWIIEIQTSN